MMRFPSLAWICGPLAALSLACPISHPRYAIWPAPRLEPGSPTFYFATKPKGTHLRPLESVRVQTCGKVRPNLSYVAPQSVWSISGFELPDSTRMLASVAYGQTPPGFREVVPVQRLVPGCYSAFVDAHGWGSVTFWVDSDLTIRPWSQRESDSSWAEYGRYARADSANADAAIAKCLTAYKTAATHSDSTRVDKEVWGDSTRFLPFTCRDYRRYHWSSFQKRPWAEDSSDGGA